MTTQLSIAIIGCGTHAQHHARQFGEYFRVAGVWDPNPEAMKQIGGKSYSSVEELLADKDVDAVMICSPDEFHQNQMSEASFAGKHVFCEKPLLTPGQSREILGALLMRATEKKLVITSCHPRRYDRPFRWLAARMPELVVRFGNILAFDFDFSYHAPETSWKHARSLLLDHINHEVDLMNFLFGISSFDAWKLHDSFDQYDVAGKRDDDVTFHFRGTRRLKAHMYPEWCRVRFERGDILLDLMQGVARISDHDLKKVAEVDGLGIDYDGRLRLLAKNFHDSITSEASPYLTSSEMMMNTDAGIELQKEGIVRINIWEPPF